MSGIVPRSAREVIFGIGLNQLSDFFEERVAFVSNAVLRTALASIVSGITAIHGQYLHVHYIYLNAAFRIILLSFLCGIF
jgi:hypothetical protein